MAWALPTKAHAFFSEIWGYVKQYELGIDYENSGTTVAATYEVNKAGATPTSSCVDLAGKPTKQTCSVTMTAGNSSGFGLFFQQAFKRQGLFYFRPDIGFGVRFLGGGLTAAEKQKELANNLPLTELDFHLAAFIIKPYIQFGITPARTWPDLLISLGPAGQVSLGQVSVNNKKENVVVATTSQNYLSGFLEIELVVLRFGKGGALSLFGEDDVSGSGTGTRFYPKSVAGMDNFYANFSHGESGAFFGFGLKLLLSWP